MYFLSENDYYVRVVLIVQVLININIFVNFT